MNSILSPVRIAKWEAHSLSGHLQARYYFPSYLSWGWGPSVMSPTQPPMM